MPLVDRYGCGKIIQISDLPAELKNEPIKLRFRNGNWREQLQESVAQGLLQEKKYL